MEETIIDGISFKSKDKEYYNIYLNKNVEFPIPKTKNNWIIEILKRWWYYKDWPLNIDYSKELEIYAKNNNLDIKEFKEVPGYLGVFQRNKKFIDLRKGELKPSFVEYKKLEINKWAEILKICLITQLNELKTSEYYDEFYFNKLKKFLQKFLKAYENILGKN